MAFKQNDFKLFRFVIYNLLRDDRMIDIIEFMMVFIRKSMVRIGIIS